MQLQNNKYNQLNQEYQTNTKKEKTIYKDIEIMKDKLSKIKRIPQHILDEYNQFEQELKRKNG